MRQSINKLTAAILVGVVQTPAVGGQFNLICCGLEGNGVPDLVYDSTTGNVTLRGDGGNNIGLFQLLSASPIFTGDPAMLPPDGLFGTDTDFEIAKAAFSPVSELNLGNVAQSGLSETFLVQNITDALVSPGFGFPNETLELVCANCGIEHESPPVGFDAALSVISGELALHMFQAIDDVDPPGSLVWSDLALNSSPASPAVAATLGADGSFSWDTSGSPLGEYSWTASVTDTGDLTGSATLLVNVVPEPASVVIWLFASVGVTTIVRRQR